jgi:hypothetical protein
VSHVILLIMVLGVASKPSKATRKRGHPSNVASSVSLSRSQYNLGSTSGSSSSRHIHRFSSSVNKITGRTTTKSVTLNPCGILKQQDLEQKDYLARTEAMSSMELNEIHAATVINDEYFASRSPSPAIDINDILSGIAPLDLSHEGGEFFELLHMDEDVLGPPAW